MWWVVGAFLLGSLLGPVWVEAANDCADACDQTYLSTATTKVTFCGTDRATRATYFEAVDTDYCYATCGLMAQYAGSCGCANDCQAAVGQGKCDSSVGLCICSPGWGGNDCSLPKAGNPCSYHGELVVGGSTKSQFPFDYCVCDAGFTGVDCSSPLFAGSALPWGELYPDVPQYAPSDAYGDAHPVFNVSHFATIRVVLDDNDYVSLLLPDNLYNESYAAATVFFDNNRVQATFANVGFRIKGAYSRLDQKKGWVIKFNEFVKGQAFFGIQKLGMKAGSVSDDTLLKTKLYNDLYRAMNAPTQRSSFALLYVNDRFAGVYYMHEDIGGDFAASRYMVDAQHYDAATAQPQDNGGGNLYKFFWNVDNLLRGAVVESFMLATDNMASGANYYLYRHAYDDHDAATAATATAAATDDAAARWSLFDADFDECFVFDRATQQPAEAPGDIVAFFVTDPAHDHYDDVNPLMNGLLAPASPFRFLAPWIARDRLWQFSFNTTTAQFVNDAEWSIAMLPLRAQDTWAQTQRLLLVPSAPAASTAASTDPAAV
eukprot:gene12876-9208_t